MSDAVLKVCIPHTRRDSFDYQAEKQNPVPGARVLVPFRSQIRTGIVLGTGTADLIKSPLKSICQVLDNETLLTEPIMTLCQWISQYYQTPLSEVIPLALPKKLRQGNEATLPLTDYYALNMPLEEARALIASKAVKQLALLELIAQQSGPVAGKFLTRSGYAKSRLQALCSQQILSCRQQTDLADFDGLGHAPPLVLNEEQAEAVTEILQQRDRYHCFLLQGITGSGKTEVYLQVIAECLARERQVLILVPEIGLTPQLLDRFRARFNVPMAVIHSDLNETERHTAWLAARHNLVRLVIGTRAAVFTPMPMLGLIVIDEEHDASLKQMEGVRYYARDCALMRAHQANIPIILGSATPSLESQNNCMQKKYTLLRLTQKALTTTPLQYQLIDLRNLPIREGLARPTIDLIRTHLQQGRQVLVFINRRGFAPVLLCHACGWMADCQACDSHLTLHRRANNLCCHHCGRSQNIPVRCQQCQGSELIPLGSGTQRIFEYLQKLFPETKMQRIDRDEIRKKHELDASLERISQGHVQLIVGTQMLAKGHHFPNLTLVVVVDTDAGFYNQDFRALEQLGQLLTQVAGRAGRAKHPGQVIIQTHLPQHPLLNTLLREGYDAFSQALLKTRQEAMLPPYHYLALIRAQDKQSSRIIALLQKIKHYLQDLSIEVLGPAPAPLARKANQHRMQLLLKSPSRLRLQAALTDMRHWLSLDREAGNVRWNVDVDPQDLS